MKIVTTNTRPEKSSSSTNNIQKIVIILGLPRSGTTLAAAIFEAHDETVVCYEPWNMGKEDKLGPRLTPHQLAHYYKQSVPVTATTFVIKETSIEIDALTWISRFIEYNCDRYLIKVIWTVRIFSHSYLSFVQRGREWWGNQNMNINMASYNLWLTNALRATDYISHIFKASPGLIYSYEALATNPRHVIKKLMETCDLAYNEKLINYFEHVSRTNIRGDRNIQRNPGAIRNDSISARAKEWMEYESELQKAPMHEIMAYLNGVSSELYKTEYIDTYDQLQCIAAIASKEAKGKVVGNYIVRQMKKKLSVIVVVDRMTEQVLNTIYSLSSHHQQEVTEQDYEIVVVEIPSDRPLDENRLYKMGSNVRYFLQDEKSKSVALAVKMGMRLVHSKFISVITNEAIVVTPGVVRATLDAIKISGDAVIAVPAYHIGPPKDLNLSDHKKARTTDLLKLIKWKEDGYRLFDLAFLSRSSNKGSVYLNMAECGFLTFPKRLSNVIDVTNNSNLEGSDFTNLKIFNRACEQKDTPIYLALFEGAFGQHQDTGSIDDDKRSGETLLSKLVRKVQDIRADTSSPASRRYEVIGKLNSQATSSLINLLSNISGQEP
jgi:Sulfotransferase domain